MDQQEINDILIENRRMRKALEYILKWELPLLEFRGEMCSYSSVRGSNGERDYMRKVAKEALGG